MTMDGFILPKFKLEFNLHQIFFLGLLVRFLLMPFFLSIDLVNNSQIVRHLGYEGVFNVYRHLYYQFGSNIWIYPPLVYFILGIFVWLFKPLMPKFAVMLASWSVDELNKASWITTPFVYRYLFLLKIPYLAFDLGTAYLLTKLFRVPAEQKKALALWMFSPFVLFASFVFGQLDILQVFFIVLSLYFLHRNRLSPAFLTLGFSIAIKQFPLILLLPMLAIVSKNFKQLLQFAGLSVIPYLIFYLPFVRDEIYKMVVLQSIQSQFFFLPSFKLGWEDTLSLFWVGWGLIFIWLLFNRQRLQRINPFEAVWRVWFFILLLFYALSLFHPQWILWLAPFLVLFFVKDKQTLWIYVALFVCFFVYLFNWQTTTSWSLLTAFNPNLFHGLLPPSSVIDTFYPSEVFIRVFRSILSAVLVALAVYVFRRLNQEYAKV